MSEFGAVALRDTLRRGFGFAGRLLLLEKPAVMVDAPAVFIICVLTVCALIVTGVDIDYEPSTSCTTVGGTISCSTDAQIVSVAAALRMQLPKGQYILSTATW